MKVGDQVGNVTDEECTFLAQLGVHYVRITSWKVTMSEPGACGVLQADEVKKLQEVLNPYDIDAYMFLLPQGPNTQYWHARFGDHPLRDQEIDNVCETIKVCGDCGVSVVEWTWSIPDTFGRVPGPNTAGRGGAHVSRFNYDLIKDKRPDYAVDMSAEEMWDNIIYFMERICPVAEQAGVLMAMHPHDPPTEWLAGEARIINSPEGMKRMIEEVDSPVNGFNICQGTVAEQAGTDVLALLRYLGERDRINMVHFRNVKGTVPVFDESFIDDGDVDMYEAMKVYKEVGYRHVFVPDHCPGMTGDPTHRASRAYAIGYIRALLHVVGEL